MNALALRPSVLVAVDAPKPWGWEAWLTSTRPEAPARIAGAEGTLADLVTAHPGVLGRWARAIFGDEMPIFGKIIHTDFPPRVHMGFRRAVRREELLVLLEREQGVMRRLHSALRIRDALAFGAYQARYSSWATAQALAGWARDDDDDAASSLREHVDPAFPLAPWLRDARRNRAAIVDLFNEIDLRRESGNLLLTSAGIVHAIFGLSHQTHPPDRSRAALESLFGALGEHAAEDDDALARRIDDAGLASLRAANGAPPKNEAWLPATIDGTDVLVEPQQSSDTTYSIADFYTPLIWQGDRARFRKGDAAGGLSRGALDATLEGVDFAVTPLDAIRRAPRAVPGGSRAGAELFCLVDEPPRWPFFTAYQVELTGTFTARPPEGVFQQIVVLRGRAGLGDAHGPIGELSPRAPGFVPATASGAYTLEAREPSTVLLFSVPGARGGAPRV